MVQHSASLCVILCRTVPCSLLSCHGPPSGRSLRTRFSISSFCLLPPPQRPIGYRRQLPSVTLQPPSITIARLLVTVQPPGSETYAGPFVVFAVKDRSAHQSVLVCDRKVSMVRKRHLMCCRRVPAHCYTTAFHLRGGGVGGRYGQRPRTHFVSLKWEFKCGTFSGLAPLRPPRRHPVQADLRTLFLSHFVPSFDEV